MCGLSPPRCAIQRRTCDGYIEYSSWVASGLVIARPLEPKGGMEAERRVRGHTDPVVRDGAENNGAGGGAEAVDDDGFA